MTPNHLVSPPPPPPGGRVLLLPPALPVVVGVLVAGMGEKIINQQQQKQ